MIALPNRKWLLLGIVGFLALNGCAGRVVLPDEKERESIRTGNKAVVLIRHSADIDSKPEKTMTSTGTRGFSLQIAHLDAFEPIRTVHYSVSPTPEERDRGWMYLLLSPGSYYLQVIPAGADQNPAASVRDVHSGRWGTIDRGAITLRRTFWFHIPDDQPVVYIGSLFIECTTGRGLFGNLIGRCSEVAVQDETAEAQSVAQRSFGGFGPLKTIPLHEYAPPVSISASSKRWNPNITGYDVHAKPAASGPQTEPLACMNEPATLYPMGISIAGMTGLVTPGWMKRALGRTTGMGGALKDMGWLGGGYGAGAIAAAYVLFYLPPAILVGSVWGQWEESKYGPCMSKLADHIVQNPPAARVQSSLEKTLAHNDRLRPLIAGGGKNADAGADGSDLKSILRIELLRIQLRECADRDTFFVETVLRSSLRDAADRTTRYHRLFLYSPPRGEDLPQDDYVDYPYLSPLATASPCRKMDEYCGEEGKKILGDEISGAIFSVLQTLQPDSGIILQ